jgi:hypothetical protein
MTKEVEKGWAPPACPAARRIPLHRGIHARRVIAKRASAARRSSLRGADRRERVQLVGVGVGVDGPQGAVGIGDALGGRGRSGTPPSFLLGSWPRPAREPLPPEGARSARQSAVAGSVPRGRSIRLGGREVGGENSRLSPAVQRGTRSPRGGRRRRAAGSPARKASAAASKRVATPCRASVVVAYVQHVLHRCDEALGGVEQLPGELG